MSIVNTVLQYLDSQNIKYSIGRTEARNSSAFRVETVLLKDALGMILVTFPANYGVDLAALGQITHRKLAFAEKKDIQTQLKGIDFPYVLPIGGIWNLQTLVEKRLFSWPHIEFCLNSDYYIRIDAMSYSRLFSSHKGFQFAHNSSEERELSSDDKLSNKQVKDLLNDAEGSKGISQLFNEQNVISKIENTKALPVMPGIVHQLLRLLGNSDANINDLVEIIEQDPALVARIISLSRAAHYAYHGNITTVFDAVYRVIGYEDAIRVALAMIFSRQLQGPLDGRVGLKALWVEAMTIAMAARHIAIKSTMSQYLNPGVMYVAGLLQNIGYLALAHLFPREYAIFNRMVTTMSDTRLADLEAGLSEISPLSVSYRVLSCWNLPGEVLAVATVADKSTVPPEFRAYCDCFTMAKYLMLDCDEEKIYPEEIKSLASRYALDLDDLALAIAEEKVAAEIPFVVDMMLG